MAGSLVGIDVGSSTIKLAEVTGGPGSLRLHRLAAGPTPPDAYYAGAIIDPIALGNAVGALMSQSGFSAKRAAVALGGTENCGLRVQEYPQMPERDLRATIRSDAERLFPFQSDLQSDYAILQAPSRDTVEVIIAGARKEYVRSWCVALRQARLSPATFDIASLAQVVSLVEAPHTQRPERCLMVVDIGQLASTISVIQDGALRFFRSTEEASGAKLTRAVHLEVKPDTETEAEQIKVHYGSVALDWGQEQDTAQVADWELQTMRLGHVEETHEDIIIAVDKPGEAGDRTLLLPDEKAAPGAAADDLFGDLGAPTDATFFGTDEGPPLVPTTPAAPAAQPATPAVPAFEVEDVAPAPASAPAAGGDFVIEEDTHLAAPGFAETGYAAAQSDEEYTRLLVGRAIVDPLALLAGEIRRTIEYYHSRHHDVDVERIVFVGGTALLPNLAEFMQRELGIHVEVGDPFAGIAVDTGQYPSDYVRQVAPLMPAALGMCVRELI